VECRSSKLGYTILGKPANARCAVPLLTLIVVTKGMQKRRVPVVGFGVIGIEFVRAAELLFGLGSVPPRGEQNTAKI